MKRNHSDIQTHRNLIHRIGYKGTERMAKPKGHLEFSRVLLPLVGAWLALGAQVLEEALYCLSGCCPGTTQHCCTAATPRGLSPTESCRHLWLLPSVLPQMLPEADL